MSSKILCLITLLLCLGCANTNVEINIKGHDFLLVKDNNDYTNRETVFSFNQSDGNETIDLSIHTNGDLSYTKYNELNNKYYFFGPGGLVEVDLQKKKTNFLSDKDINEISFYNDEIFVYENVGFSDQGNYVSKIYSLNSDQELELDYPVVSFEVYDNKIYVLNSILSSEDESNLYIYENNTLIQTLPAEEIGHLFLDKGVLYFVSDNYALNLVTNEKLSYVDEEDNNFHLEDTYRSFIKIGEDLYNIQSNSQNEKTIIYRVEEGTNLQFIELYSFDVPYLYYSYSGGNEIVLVSDNNKYLILDFVSDETQEVEINDFSNGWSSKNIILTD